MEKKPSSQPGFFFTKQLIPYVQHRSYNPSKKQKLNFAPNTSIFGFLDHFLHFLNHVNDISSLINCSIGIVMIQEESILIKRVQHHLKSVKGKFQKFWIEFCNVIHAFDFIQQTNNIFQLINRETIFVWYTFILPYSFVVHLVTY